MGKKSLQALGIALLILLGGCALKHDLNVSGDLNVVHTIDADTLYAFFLDLCNGDEQCADDEMNQFLTWLYSTGGNN